jgi:hypothetical protein
MGFCRRCGDIVSGERCKCGGTAVAASTHFSKPFASEQTPDKWSKTYVSRDKSPERKPAAAANVVTHYTGGRLNGSSEAPSSPARRFPRPLSSYSSSSSTPFSGSSSSATISNRVSTHIASATSRPSRPPSPLKHSTTPAPESDILPSLYGSSLTKVYGSVLQTQESLATYSCAICDTQFQPDATIYPDPNNPTSTDRFLCLSCFTGNGGSKGSCPTCFRPVLAIKSQGGFVQASGKVWHKQCFNCTGCHKNIGDAPIVNLLGQPSCVDCFDGCLKTTTPKKKAESVTSSPVISSIGIPSSRTPGENRARESSPVMEELEQRLGIRSRETSPALDELDKRLTSLTSKDRFTPTRQGPSSRYSSYRSPEQSPSPISAGRGRRDSSCSPTRPSIKQQLTGSTARHSLADSPKPMKRTLTGSSAAATEEAVEQMKRRFLRESVSSSHDDYPSTPSPRRIRRPRSSASLRSPASPHITDTQPFSDYGSPIPSTPDLLSDISDSATQTSLPSSPPSHEHEKYMVDELQSPKPLKISKRLSRGESSDQPQVRTRTMSTPSSSPMAKSVSSAAPFTPSRGRSEPDHPISPSSCCAKCGGGLFSVNEGVGSATGKFMTIPDDENLDGGRKSKFYHTECFRCTVCDGTFREGGKGQAIFVRAAGGPCHTECAPPERIVLKSTPNSSVVPSIFSKMPAPATSVSPSKSTTWDPPSSKLPPRPQTVAPPAPLSFPRFGSSNTCPGCHKSVSPMERGVVPGPQGTRWHASCLVCGGKKEFQGLFAPRRKKDEPGCGKKLDSAAKGDMEGGVWCRDCLLLLPSTMRDSPQSSPTRQTTIIPSHTGGSTRGISAQYTGTTTIARQFTGMGSGGEAALIRQMTGGGLSPTRQLSSSPTKQLGTASRALGRPRPKSVVGFRMDENGKVGGLLSRQTTGSSAASGPGWRY